MQNKYKNKNSNMINDILNEELSISNDVNDLTIKIKNLISNDYARNIGYERCYTILYKGFNREVFSNEITINYANKSIIVVYYVLEDASQEITKQYNSLFNSTSNNRILRLELYLTSHNNKINWKKNSKDLQHEVEHLFQLIKKGKDLLSDKQFSEYNKLKSLTTYDDYYDQIIGYTYYYYNKAERNAIINGLYREIIDLNTDGLVTDPLEIIKKSPYYHNIQIIKNTIENHKNHEQLENKLKNINKTLKQYLRIANIVIDEYSKAFGRLLYKVKKDIESVNEDLLINLSNRRITKF